ncbi:MAG TPA: ATP-binding cassette domain-containing protein [Bacteroidia bacterium]|jgi:ABC-type multidrug transport system ATPase subunit|nr:ATP-binding cassette domain-containing protein [Bacteroidia bacterium]
MTVTLSHIGKRFNRESIFSGVSHVFQENIHTVIQGSNGSGKSTLLQIIAGNTTASEGQISYSHAGKTIGDEQIFRLIGFASPYMELLEELTITELAAFQGGLKPFRKGITGDHVAELAGLSQARNKQIRHFSSGMKQRAKLALAILSDTPLLLLDEPCSNLDAEAISWYQALVRDHSSDRLILVCSNQQEQEYPFCSARLSIEAFKQR